MAKAKFDAKEFFLNYGDRVGLGVTGFLAVLFLVFAMIGGGSGISADTVKQSGQTADAAIKSSVPDPDDIALKGEQGIYPLAQIDKLSKSLAFSFPIDVLSLTFPFYEPELLRGKYRANPEAFKPTEIAAFPLVGAFKRYETRTQGNDIYVMVLSPQNPNNAPKLPGGGNNPLNRGGIGSGGGMGGAAPPPPGGFGGGLGIGSGSGGLSKGGGLNKGGRGTQPPGKGAGGPGRSGGPSNPASGQGSGGDEFAYKVDWKKVTDVHPTDVLGVTIQPVRNVMIVASYPHAKQVDELARKLQVEKHEIPRYYHGLDVQRRVVVEKNHLLPDGTIATADMALVLDPKDPSKTLYRPIEEVDKLAQPTGDLNEDETRRDALAGWVKVDMHRVVGVMGSAYRVARATNEGFYTEKDPTLEQLVEHAGSRVAMRLPKLVRGDYPDLYKDLKQLHAAVMKIKDDATAKIAPPPKDPRLERGNPGDDPFGALADDEQRNKDQGKDNNTGRPSSGDSTPNVTGAIPDLIVLRFLDVDLDPDVVGGMTYEYRIRMVLDNPNWKQEKLVAAPDFAKVETIAGPWSDPRRVSFQPDSLAYADERVRAKGATSDSDKDKAPVQLHRWIGRTENTERDPVTVGDWWIERMLTARGEYVGKSPDLPGQAGEVNLIQWVSYAYDAVNQMVGADVRKPTRTTAMLTRTLLVDFTGGTFQSFPGLNNRGVRREDIPVEVLLLEPDGRLTAHIVADDRNDEGRKARFTHWEEWNKKLNKPKDKENSPAPGGAGARGPAQ